MLLEVAHHATKHTRFMTACLFGFVLRYCPLGGPGCRPMQRLQTMFCVFGAAHDRVARQDA
jgi:hypothetical protein